MTEPLIYAEVLTNIRQVSVVAVLGLARNDTPKAELEDGERLTIRYGGSKSTLKLPRKVSPVASLTVPPQAGEEITWRLPIADKRQSSDIDSAKDNPTPWPAKSLNADIQFLCQRCDAVIVKKGRIRSWRDLPSDNWAEMMDFWHCHKPSVDNEKSNIMVNRGYGANSKLTAQKEKGFVDMTTFLLSEEDCPGVKAENRNPTAEEHTLDDYLVVCNNCNGYVGRVDFRADGYRLYKWTLKVDSQSAKDSKNFPPQLPIELVISGHLISTMEAQCCSQFLFIPSEWHAFTPDASDESTLLRVWVINPALRFASSKLESDKATLAMKIFHKQVPANCAAQLLENGRERLEEVRLPRKAINDIQGYIRSTAEYLPLSARRFQDWDVGFWERYEG